VDSTAGWPDAAKLTLNASRIGFLGRILIFSGDDLKLWRRGLRPTDFVAERDKMVRGLIQEGLLRTPQTIAAMKKVPREVFVPEHLRAYAYNDSPLPTDYGQTISAPHGSTYRAIHGRHHE